MYAKFRAKTTSGGDWVYGDLRHITAPDGSTVCEIQQRRIDPETIGLCTDYRDITGREIYEGDIIRIIPVDGGKEYTSEVGEYGEVDCWGCSYDRTLIKWLPDCDFEIIGNIHDNPELLN